MRIFECALRFDDKKEEVTVKDFLRPWSARVSFSKHSLMNPAASMRVTVEHSLSVSDVMDSVRRAAFRLTRLVMWLVRGL